jgi:hypothetical protein
LKLSWCKCPTAVGEWSAGTRTVPSNRATGIQAFQFLYLFSNVFAIFIAPFFLFARFLNHRSRFAAYFRHVLLDGFDLLLEKILFLLVDSDLPVFI